MRAVPSQIVRALEVEAPQFVNSVARDGEGVVFLSWAFVEDRPDLLYNCVWFALAKGKSVVVESSDRRVRA